MPAVSLSPPLDALYPFWRCQALPRCPGIWAGKETSRYNGQHRRGAGGDGQGRRGAEGWEGSSGAEQEPRLRRLGCGAQRAVPCKALEVRKGRMSHRSLERLCAWGTGGAGRAEGRVGQAGVWPGFWEQGLPGHTSTGSGSRARPARGLGGEAEGDTCSPGGAGASDLGRGSRGRLRCWLEGGLGWSVWSQEAGGLETRIQDRRCCERAAGGHGGVWGWCGWGSGDGLTLRFG